MAPRLYKLVPTNMSQEQRNTTLLYGECADRKSQIFVRDRGADSHSLYVMHPPKHLWGNDVDDLNQDQ